MSTTLSMNFPLGTQASPAVEVVSLTKLSGMKLVREREASPRFNEVNDLFGKISKAKHPLFALRNPWVIEWALVFSKQSWKATYSTYTLDGNLGLRPELNGHFAPKSYVGLVNYAACAFMFQARCEDFFPVCDDVFMKDQVLTSTAMGAGVPELSSFKRAKSGSKLVGIDLDEKAKRFASNKVAKDLCLERDYEYHIADARGYQVTVENACVSSIGFATNYLPVDDVIDFFVNYFRNPKVVRFVADGIINNTLATEQMKCLFGVPTVDGLVNRRGRYLQSYDPEALEMVVGKAAKLAGRRYDFGIVGEGYKYGYLADIKLR